MLDRFFLRFPQNKAKAVSFSYDDGCRQDIRLAKLFAEKGLKCTFNINSDFFGLNEDDWHLTKEEMQTNFLDLGHEIALHGARHIANGMADPLTGIQDVLNCRLKLEKEFGIIINGMAYPDTGVTVFHNNNSYEKVRNYLNYLGVSYARALCGTAPNFNLPTDWYCWLPTAHHNDPQIFEKIDTFLNLDLVNCYHSSCFPRLLYIWGHSFEFDNNNNWDVIEKIAEKVSFNDEIWYATNIEIYNYVKAYNSLVFSADHSIVHNPTTTTVWFFVDGNSYSIKPDETLKIV